MSSAEETELKGGHPPAGKQIRIIETELEMNSGNVNICFVFVLCG
jgi:hypothetical protein